MYAVSLLYVSFSSANQFALLPSCFQLISPPCCFVSYSSPSKYKPVCSHCFQVFVSCLVSSHIDAVSHPLFFPIKRFSSASFSVLASSICTHYDIYMYLDCCHLQEVSWIFFLFCSFFCKLSRQCLTFTQDIILHEDEQHAYLDNLVFLLLYTSSSKEYFI